MSYYSIHSIDSNSIHPIDSMMDAKREMQVTGHVKATIMASSLEKKLKLAENLRSALPCCLIFLDADGVLNCAGDREGNGGSGSLIRSSTSNMVLNRSCVQRLVELVCTTRLRNRDASRMHFRLFGWTPY